MEIKIPTPITVHLDNCPKCSQDLEKIRELHLTQKKLSTLSRMYADKSESRVTCSQAEKSISSITNLHFEEINTDTLKHLCLCPSCRHLIYQQREFNIEQTSKSKDNYFCKQLSPADLFYYAIPYDLDLLNDQYSKFRESLASHTRKCRDCLVKIQDFHQLIFGILERPESGITTVCKIKPTQMEEANTEDLYAEFPLQVRVSGLESDIKKQTILSINTAHNRKLSLKRLARYAAISGLAAAITIIAVFFTVNTPTVKATSLDQVYESVNKVKNVYIERFTPGKNEPFQRQWVSRSLDVYISNARGEQVIWDIRDGTRKIINIQNGKIDEEALSSEDVTNMENFINGSLGMMPFDKMSVQIEDAKWNRLEDMILPGSAAIMEVYELLWVDKNSSISNKWRVFVEASTNLPRRTEFYQILRDEQEYTFSSFSIIEYPTDNDIKAIISK